MSKSFATYYRATLDEVAKSAAGIHERTEKAAASDVFKTPALKEFKELMDKYLNYANHALQFFSQAAEMEIDKVITHDIEGLIDIAIAKEDEMKSENFKEFTHEKVVESYQEKLKKGQLVYNKLLIITRQIMTNIKMIKKTQVVNRLQDSLTVATYMAVESYAAAKGRKVMAAEELFPDYREAIMNSKKLRMVEVIEVSMVSEIFSGLSVAQKIVKDINAMMFDPPKDEKPVSMPRAPSPHQQFERIS